MKIGMTILGALIGPFVGFFGVLWLLMTFPPPDDNVWGLGAIYGAFIYGIPVGTITFCLLGLWLGGLLERKAKKKQLVPERISQSSS